VLLVVSLALELKVLELMELLVSLALELLQGLLLALELVLAAVQMVLVHWLLPLRAGMAPCLCVTAGDDKSVQMIS
jgi:hypothetical protein